MKSYRRNWFIGLILVLVGIAMFILSPPGFMKTASGYIIGAGLIIAGWFGRIWIFEEKQGNLSKLLKN